MTEAASPVITRDKRCPGDHYLVDGMLSARRPEIGIGLTFTWSQKKLQDNCVSRVNFDHRRFCDCSRFFRRCGIVCRAAFLRLVLYLLNFVRLLVIVLLYTSFPSQILSRLFHYYFTYCSAFLILFNHLLLFFLPVY